MNAVQMCQYIQFCADRLVQALGHEKIYNAPNPFEWMTSISLQGKTNFFEKRVGEYSKASVGVAREEQVFKLDAEF
jgi:ribonucleoside-diphosphate reductase subunit M2